MFKKYKFLLFVVGIMTFNCGAMEEQNFEANNTLTKAITSEQRLLIRQKKEEIEKEHNEVRRLLAEKQARKQLRAQNRQRKLANNTSNSIGSIPVVHDNQTTFFSKYLCPESIFLAFIGLMFALKKVFNFYIESNEEEDTFE